MSATPISVPRYFVRDPMTDVPLVGAKIFTYIAGTTTPADTWADDDKFSENTNPVITDADGGADIFGDGLYKFIVYRADDTLLYEVDGIIGGTAVFDRPASGVMSLPFDDIVADDVQAAIEELGQKRVKDTDVIDIAHGGTGSVSASEARTNLGVAIGSNVQAWDTDLDVLAALGARVFSGMLYGLTLSSNGANPTTQVDIAAGRCIDSTNLHFMTCAAMTKRLDQGWAVGTGNGFRYSGAAITDTTYHIYAVTTAAGVQDYYADPSTVIATVLAHLQAETGGSAYIYARRIFSIVRVAAAIKKFYQLGDNVVWDVQTADDAQNNPGTAARSITLTVPTGIIVRARVVAGLVDSSASPIRFMLITALEQADTAPALNLFTLAMWDGGSAGSGNSALADIKTDTLGRIRSRMSSGGANITQYISTVGYYDDRGRDG